MGCLSPLSLNGAVIYNFYLSMKYVINESKMPIKKDSNREERVTRGGKGRKKSLNVRFIYYFTWIV